MLLTVFIWGAGFPLAKYVLGTMSPYTFNAIRFGIGSVILSIIFRKHIKSIDKKIVIDALILGLFIFFGSILCASGLQRLTSVEGSIYLGLQIPFVPVLAFFLIKEKVSMQKIVAILIAFFGIIAMNNTGSGISLSFGAVLAILSALMYALQMVYIEKCVEAEDTYALVIMQGVFVSIFAFASNIIINKEVMTITKAFNVNHLIAILVIGLIVNAGSYLFQGIAQKTITATDAAIITAFTPIFGVVSGIIILGEKLSIGLLYGMLYIVGATIVANLHITHAKKHAKQY